MRNLKKFLALVMAMVMAFSLMLSASAANPVKTFGDADQITEAFVEAADVLTGMKVFQGDEGGFRPGDNITRAEVAALIYRLATGDTGTEKMDLYTTTHPFTDVGADDWFAGYVGYCWNAGYIKGTTATTFNPYDSVTGYETLAMILRAMGYDKNNEFTGAQWIVNVSATATQRGLLEDVKTTHYGNTLHLASRRDVVASILFQAAQKTRVVYTPAFGYQSGDHTTGTGTDNYSAYSSLGWLNFGLTYANDGVVIGNQQTGEKNTRLGWAGTQRAHVDGSSIASGTIYYTPFTWAGRYDVTTTPGTMQISKYWQAKDGGGDIALPSDGDISTITTPAVNITGTNNLGIPFRDTTNSTTTSVNGLGEGLYTGFAINGDTVDSIVADTNTDRNEHLANMARLGIKYAAFDTTGLTANKNLAFDIREIVIDGDDITLGARETVNNSDWQNGRADPNTVPYSNKYFTEATKFILVEGYGTDSVKAEVYNGISELRGNAAHVFIKMNGAQDGAGNDTTIKLNSAWDDYAANLMTYYTESPYTYAQSGDTAMKIDTIILPKAAVSWSGGSGLYYVGNPAYSSINSWGTDAWKYDLYEDGELKQVWLTNDPSVTTAGQADTQLTKDSFYNLKDTGKKANDGEPIYTAGNYNGNGVWAAGTRVNSSVVPTDVTNWANQGTMAPDIAAGDAVIYSAVTRDAQTATFTQYKDNAKAKLYRVAEAKVVNLNKAPRPPLPMLLMWTSASPAKSGRASPIWLP